MVGKDAQGTLRANAWWDLICHDMREFFIANPPQAVCLVRLERLLAEMRGEPLKAEPVSILDTVTYPEGFDTPEVRQAIMDWLEYKRERKPAYKSPAKQITRLLEIQDDGTKRFPTPAVFVDSVNHSIGQNYAGCYPAGRKQGASEAKVTPRPPRLADVEEGRE